MKSYMVPDAAVGVLHNWIEEDGAACAAQELDRVIDFLIKLHNEDAEEVLKHIRAVYFFRNEITAFIPEKGGEK